MLIFFSFHICQAKELEALTHCKISMTLKTRHAAGKTYSHHSALPGVDVPPPAPEQEPEPEPAREPEPEQAREPEPEPAREPEPEPAREPELEPAREPEPEPEREPAPVTPQKRRRIRDPPQQDPNIAAAGPSHAPTVQDVNKCRVCGEGDKVGKDYWWLGCGYKANVRHSCRYWVHQRCLGLKYIVKKKLDEVPFFCPNHI